MDDEAKEFIKTELRLFCQEIIKAIEKCTDRELSIEESACYLNTSRNKIYELIKKEEIRSVRRAGHKQTYILKSVLDDYILRLRGNNDN